MARPKAEPKPDEPKRGVGRPKKPFNKEVFERLCSVLCTKEEIAAFFDFSLETLENKVKEEYEDNFSGAYQKFSANGKSSLRRMQFKAAQKGNVVMQIWLGKQVLGQSDKQQVEHSGNVTIIKNDVPRE